MKTRPSKIQLDLLFSQKKNITLRSSVWSRSPLSISLIVLRSVNLLDQMLKEKCIVDRDNEGEPTIFKGTDKSTSRFHATIAMGFWLGFFNVDVFLFISLFFLPIKFAVMLLGMFLLLVFIPIEEKSEIGQKFSRYVCKHICAYFPLTLHVEDIKAFDPSEAYVFGFVPHSTLTIGVIAFAERICFMPLPKIKVLTSSAIYYTPFVRHAWRWLGFLPATRTNFISLLENGCSCVIVPGGTQEAFLTEHNSEVAFLNNRKGFIRVAIETGRPLVPVYCYGQNHVYKWWKPKGKLYLRFARAMKFTPIVLWGEFGSSLPYAKPLHIVVGKPMKLKRNAQPTIEEVNEVHGQFIEALRVLFETHKARVGYPDLPLKIV